MLMREITEKEFQSGIIIRVMMSKEIKAYKEMSCLFSKNQELHLPLILEIHVVMTFNIFLVMMRKSLEASD